MISLSIKFDKIVTSSDGECSAYETLGPSVSVATGATVSELSEEGHAIGELLSNVLKALDIKGYPKVEQILLSALSNIDGSEHRKEMKKILKAAIEESGVAE